MPRYSKEIENAEEYPFPKVGKISKEVEKRDGIPIINARIGIPDREAPQVVKEAMAKYILQEKSTYGYPCDVHPERGIPELMDAIIQHYDDVHGVDLKPENIAVTSWSKGTLHNLPRLYGDGHSIVLNFLSSLLSLFNLRLGGSGNGVVPEPIYPAYEGGVNFSNHRIRRIPTYKKSGWLPRFEFEKNDTFLFFCDPNNPTGTVANESYYDELLDDMKRADVGGIFDKAYKNFVFDGSEPAISITQISDLMDYGYEVDSLSKEKNFVGIGGGCIVSSKENIDRWFKLADKFSQGVPWFIQKTMVEALTNPEVKKEMSEYMKELKERRDTFAKGLNDLGLKCEVPKATPYLFPEVPKGYDDENFVLNTLIGKAHVAAMPGSYFGKSGSGHVRFTLYVEKPQIVEALRRIDEIREW